MFFSKRVLTQLARPPLNELRKRTRILVIDDDVNSFPFEVLRREGYSIDHWPKVQSLGPLEKGDFDIIFLDIAGVAAEYSSEDGLGILEHIKKANPSQIVVAFSGQSFDLSRNKFWRMTDDSLRKPVDATKCKQVIDELIENNMTVQHYWHCIEEILRREGIPDKKLAQIQDSVTRALERKDGKAAIQSIASALDKAELAVKVATIAVKICGLLGI